jgi:hypothetical protein
MEKCRLTSMQLQCALIKLIECHIITRSDVPEKLPTQYATLAPEGVRLAELQPTVGVVSTIVALGDDVEVISPFEFLAQCLWAKQDVSGNDYRSSFQIVAISGTDRPELKKLIRIVPVGW